LREVSARPKIDPDDGERALAARIAARDVGAVRLVMQRNNQRLFRTAWGILKNRAEAEDAVQSGYLRAFRAIGEFEGRSSLDTWLMPIVINEALGRARSRRRRRAHLERNRVAIADDYREKLMRGSASGSPDSALAREQIRKLLEEAIAQLPDAFRLVFVLRDIEGLSGREAADALGIGEATVKTRLLRARRRLRQALAPELKSALEGSFPFAGADCEAMTESVLRRLGWGDER
jgi:RNA polymerase sigma-70 factor, ECF subfamily